MSEATDTGRENPEYAEAKRRFEAAYDTSPMGGPYRDDAFMADAIMVFCIEAYRNTADTVQAKSAKSIASRLMGSPEMRKEWLVTFPFVWSKKETALTPSDMKRRSIGFDVIRRVWEGVKVTHAVAQVATERHMSPQKVTKDYYDWKPHHERLKTYTSGENIPSISIEQKKE